MEATPRWATSASAPCKEPVRRTWASGCLLGMAVPRAWLSFQWPATSLASVHFDSGQFPPSFSAEFQKPGVKLQEITTTQRSGCPGITA